MIDRNNLDRHIIVKKQNEVTNIFPVDSKNYGSEEVIFHAVGTSVYDSVLKQNNLMLEGLTDKEIIRLFNEFNKKNGKNFIDFNKVGLCYAYGVNKILPQVLLTSDSAINYLVVVDSDHEGLNEKKKLQVAFPEKSDMVFDFKTIIGSDKSTFTVEDILPTEWILEILNKHLESVVVFPSKLFLISGVKRDAGIIDSWNAFVSANYSAHRDKLKFGYKEKIPSFIRNRFKNGDVTDSDLENFNKLISFVKSKIN